VSVCVTIGFGAFILRLANGRFREVLLRVEAWRQQKLEMQFWSCW
jgi:hypothetical protein